MKSSEILHAILTLATGLARKNTSLPERHVLQLYDICFPFEIIYE